MITIMNRIKDWSFLAVCCVCTSCSLDIPYENQFSDPDAITTPAAARELLASAYTELPSPEFDLSALGDDFEPTYLIARNSTLSNLYKWQPQPLEDTSLSLWQGYYTTIAIANAVLERIDYVTVSSDNERQEVRCIISEAKLLKAYCYFYLLRLFAPAYSDGSQKDGIILKDQLQLGFMKRSTIEECVTAIRNLLLEAVEVENNPSQEYWFSQYSGYYLLAALELYAQNFDRAEAYAQKVIDFKGGYEVLGAGNYGKLFGNETSQERVFSSYTTNSYYIGMNYDRTKGDFFTVNASLIDLYSTGDLRYGESVYWFAMPEETANATTTIPYLGKYNRMNWEKKELKYINRFRVAGACFILAEAYCRDDKGHDAEAVEVMNNYLNQREAALLDENLSGDALLKAILQEKWKEFVGEGERYFDLKRHRKDVLADWNTTAAMKDKRIQKDDYRWTFPIPKGEYLYNENVSQNEGWTKIEN